MKRIDAGYMTVNDFLSYLKKFTVETNIGCIVFFLKKLTILYKWHYCLSKGNIIKIIEKILVKATLNQAILCCVKYGIGDENKYAHNMLENVSICEMESRNFIISKVFAVENIE